MNRALGPGGVAVETSGELWPDAVNPRLAQLLADCHMISILERRPAEEIVVFQRRRLAALLRHAATASAWWREHLAAVTRSVPARLTELPLMDRLQFRASAAGGPLPVLQGHGPTREHSTSGSTGTPARFHVSNLAKRLNRAHYHHDHVRQGRDLARLQAVIKGALPAHSGDCFVEKAQLPGTRPVVGRRATQFTIEEHACWLARVKPAYFATTPAILSGLLHAYERGIAEPPALEQVMTFAETVEQELRVRAKSVLGASLRDRYSCEEVGPLAFQCPDSDEHYHVAATNVVLEILDEAGKPCPPGVVGRVFATGLNNYANPVLRYELGDLAAWHPRCPCGYAGGALERMLGRKRFLIRLLSGEHKFVRVDARHWLGVAPVTEHRLVQVDEGVIRAELVLSEPLSDDHRAAIVAMLRSEIDPTLAYEISEVEAIAWGSSYKRQDVVSQI
jgi:phenylacetate-CoA ligase